MFNSQRFVNTNKQVISITMATIRHKLTQLIILFNSIFFSEYYSLIRLFIVTFLSNILLIELWLQSAENRLVDKTYER